MAPPTHKPKLTRQASPVITYCQLPESAIRPFRLKSFSTRFQFRFHRLPSLLRYGKFRLSFALTM